MDRLIWIPILQNKVKTLLQEYWITKNLDKFGNDESRNRRSRDSKKRNRKKKINAETVNAE